MSVAERKHRLSFVFDLDGTLVDSAPGIQSALGAAFHSVGRDVPQASLRAAIGPPIRVIAKRLVPELSEADAAAIEVAYRELYDASAWLETNTFPDVLSTLQTLRREGHRLFVATNKPRIPAAKILERFRLAHLMEDVATRDLAQTKYSGKREMLASLTERNGLSAEECVMVGDTAEDEDAARANGMSFAFVTHGYGEANAADYRLDGFAELLVIAGLGEVSPSAPPGRDGRS